MNPREAPKRIHCAVCGATKVAGKSGVAITSRDGYYELPKPAFVPAGKQICWHHDSMEDRRDHFLKATLDQIRCARESFDCGHLTQAQMLEEIGWAERQREEFIAEWERNYGRVRAASQQHIQKESKNDYGFGI